MTRSQAADFLRAHSIRPSWRALIISLAASSLAACGGGDAPSSSQTKNSQAAVDAPLSPQFVPVVSGLVSGPGWVAAPPIVQASSATSTKSGRVFYVETLWGATNQSTAGRDGSSPDKAWLNLRDFAKVQFQAGDTILLRCGSVWREQLVFSAVGSGNAAQDAAAEAKGYYVNPSLGNGVKIGVYATPTQSCTDTNLPVIRASDYTGALVWSPKTIEGRSIMRAEKNDYTVVSRLFRWSKPETVARYPNETPNQRYAYAVAVEKGGNESDGAWAARRYKQFKVSEAVRQDLLGKDLAGATVYIRTTAFQIQHNVVSSYDPATGLVTLAKNLGSKNNPIQAASGIGYFFQGKPWMIDQPGEWVHANGELLYYPRDAKPVGIELTHSSVAGASPPQYQVRYFGIKLVGINNLTIERVRFEHQEYGAISIEGSSNVTVSGVHVVYPREIGIGVGKAGTTSSNNILVTKSRVLGASAYGIAANMENSPGRVQFHDNYVADVGVAVGNSSSSTSFEAGIGIRVSGINSEAKNNYVINTGAAGVWFSGDGAGLIVEGNTVFNACVRLADCGGIYTFPDVTQASANSLPKPLAAETPKYLRNNLVIGVLGDIDGVASSALKVTNVPGRYLAHGIYLDSHSRNIEISGNQIAGTQVGIYLHNAAWNYVHDNRVKSASQASLLVSDDWPLQAGTKGLIRGNRFINNTWFSHRRVDPAAFNSSSQSMGSIQAGIDQVYAQFWAHPTDPKQFFEDSAVGDRNVSEGNTTLTLSKVESPAIWRVGSAGKMVQASGGAWATKAGAATHVELGLNQWLRLLAPPPGATLDSEASPVSYKAYVASLGGDGSSLIADFLLPQTPKTWFPNFSSGGNFSVQAGLTECGAAPSCGVLMGGTGEHIVASKPFSLTQNTMYFAQYGIRSGNEGASHNALVRMNAAPWTSVASVPTFQLEPNEERRIEHFFRATSNASNMVLALRPSDGTTATAGKTVYLNTARLHPVSSVQVLGALETFSVTLANTTKFAKSFSCQDTGLSNCADVRDENNSVVTMPVNLPARSIMRLYTRPANWPN